MKYDKTYLLTRDIDWFFRLNGKPIHVASAGGALPDEINDRENLRMTQNLVANLPDINKDEDIDINHVLIDRICENTHCKKEDYLSSFFAIAKKGFISIDKTCIEDFKDTRYHVVCIPKHYYSGEELLLIDKLQKGFNFVLEMMSSFDISGLF